MMEKILIHSYKGGTGKTTISINLADWLSSKNKVLLIENDFMMPSFFSVFNYEPEHFFNDYLNNKVSFKEIITPNLRNNLDVIFTNKNFNPNEKVLSSDQVWFISALERMAEDFKKLEDTYDYIIFDTPPGWHMVLINLIMLSNKAVLILRPNNYAVDGTKRMIDILYKRAKPLDKWEIFFVFNQVPERADFSTDLERWKKEFQKEGIKYGGEIPCSCKTAYLLAHEKNIFPKDHEFIQSLEKIMEKIL